MRIVIPFRYGDFHFRIKEIKPIWPCSLFTYGVNLFSTSFYDVPHYISFRVIILCFKSGQLSAYRCPVEVAVLANFGGQNGGLMLHFLCTPIRFGEWPIIYQYPMMYKYNTDNCIL